MSMQVLNRAIKITSLWLLLCAVQGCGRSALQQSETATVEPKEAPKVEPEIKVIPPAPADPVPADPAPAVPAPDNPLTFKQLDAASGIVFKREDDIGGQRRIFESTGGGVGVFDYDNDGWLDLVFTGGCKLPLAPGPQMATCGLFRNLGKEQFSSSAAESRLLQAGYCQGVAIGDFDNDGFDDAYITAFGQNSLWHNCGDGTFEDRTPVAGVAMASWSTSCAFADVNADGNLDLYVVNYLEESAESPTQCVNPRAPDGFEQCPPSKFQGVDDALFLGDGAGGFRDVTIASGLAGLKGKGLGLVIGDLDGVLGPEIYIANDGEANFLFSVQVSDDSGVVLQDRGLLAGVALTRSGYAQASMGVAAGDYDGNGTIDLLATSFYGDSDTLYKNNSGFNFEDVTRSTGLAGPSRSALGWGTAFVDLDNNGRLDLVVANGHVEDRGWNGQNEPYQMLPQVFRNEGGGKFTDVSRYAGGYFNTKWLGRGLASGDFDRDGRIDLAISHQLAPSAVLINQTTVSQSMACVRLVGTTSNRNAIGAKLEILDKQGNVAILREITAGTSFQSSSSQEFCLPRLSDLYKIVRITWPSGRIQAFDFPQVSSTTVVEERSSQ